MSPGESKTSQEAQVNPLSPVPSILCLLSLPPPSPGHPLALQYQIGCEAQVDGSQQSYKDEVGRVWEAGQVDDHEVEVDGTDQSHDEGCDGLAQPGGRRDAAQDWLHLFLFSTAQASLEETDGMRKATFSGLWDLAQQTTCPLLSPGPSNSTLVRFGKSRVWGEPVRSSGSRNSLPPQIPVLVPHT